MFLPFFSSVTTDPARKPVLPPLGSKPLINPLTLAVFLMCQQLQSAFAVWLPGGIWSHSRGCLQNPCSVLCGWGRHSQLSALNGWVQVFPKRTPQLLLGFPSPARSPGWRRDRWRGTAFFCASWPVSASNLHARFSCRVNRDRLLRRHVGTNPSEHKTQASQHHLGQWAGGCLVQPAATELAAVPFEHRVSFELHFVMLRMTFSHAPDVPRNREPWKQLPKNTDNLNGAERSKYWRLLT